MKRDIVINAGRIYHLRMARPAVCTASTLPAIIFVIDVEARRLHNSRQGGGVTNGNGL